MAYLPQDSDSDRDRPLISAQGSKPAMVYGGMLAPVSPRPSQFLEYCQVIRGNFLFIVILALVGALVGWTVALIRPSIYEARTVLDIRNLNENILTENASTSIGTSGNLLPESYLQTEIKILQSDSIRKRAIEQLIKEKRPAGSQKVDPTPAWSLRALDPGNIPFEKLVADAGGRIKVRALGNTRMVEMLCDARDAQLAADVCNLIARTYSQYNVESRAASTKETGDWLSSRLDDLRVRLTSAEAELKDASRESSVILDSDVENLAQEKLRQLQAEISKIQAERIYKESEYEVVQRTPAGALPLALDAGPIRDYRLRLTELRRQVAELTSTMTPAHYRVRELTNQITELESALKSEQTNLISRLKADYQTALQRESMLQKAYDQQAELVTQRGDKAVRYNMLKRQVESERKLYDTLLQRVQEVGLAAALHSSTISVVDPAVPAAVPYSPDTLASVGVGFFAASCLGVGFSFLRLRNDHTLQNPGDSQFQVHVRELGAIPSVHRPLGRGRRLPLPRVAQSNDNGPIRIIDASTSQLSNSIALGTWNRNRPQLAEAFHSTMNSLLFTANDRTQVIVITSPEAGDGKTTAATNLAVAIAEIGRRVVLVDGDLRRPSLAGIFGIGCLGGLAKLLEESEELNPKSLATALLATEIENLVLLPTTSARQGISAKLHSGLMRQILTQLRIDFDVVIIDAPPMLHLSDARVLGWLADGVLLVFRSRKTTRGSAMAAVDCFAQDGIPVLGTILNDWNPRKSKQYPAYSSYVDAAS